MVAQLTPALLDGDKTTAEGVQKAMINDLRAVARMPDASKPKVYFYIAAKVRLKDPKQKPVNLLIVTKDEKDRKLWDARLKDHTPRITTGLCKVDLVKDNPAITIGALKGSGDRKAAMLVAKAALKDAGKSKYTLADERDKSKAGTKVVGKTSEGKTALAQAAAKTEQLLATLRLNPKSASAASKQLGVSTDVVNYVISQNADKLKAAIANALKDAGLEAAS